MAYSSRKRKRDSENSPEIGDIKKNIIEYKNGNKYDGFLLRTNKTWVRDGKGIMTYQNGNIYDGEWKNNMWHGNGKLIMNNEDKCVGKWENSKYIEGIIYYSNGNRYEGHGLLNLTNIIYNSPQNGFGWNSLDYKSNGIMYYANGDKYEGDWILDKYVKGVLLCANGDQYKGKWKYSYPTNFRYAHFDNEYEYEDIHNFRWNRWDNIHNFHNFHNFHWNENQDNNKSLYGKGIIEYANGDIYRGTWNNKKKTMKLE